MMAHPFLMACPYCEEWEDLLNYAGGSQKSGNK